ncbi:cell cycle checkpoint protein RAD1 isoform X2 [Hydra vulgaris]|uniref:cell cycle checkpoint protein RAD1 isoform X2 n=1 Tax=Hydra vulgaris TaxID=6087 RepID=UPI000640D42B|nr:cell cycle checkpoint protein RAD1 isoform X2 [Hydra vulgaris]
MLVGDTDNSEYILIAKLDNAKNLSTLLKAIHFRESAIIFVSENGLKVTVEESKFLQECLHIFGGSESSSHTALKMCYAGHGFPLKLLLAEDGGVLTECSINTQDPEEIVDFNFTSSEVRNKIIMKSAALKDVFQELDMSSDVIQLLLSPASPYFRISTFGNSGSIHVDYPRDSEMIETFECQQTQSSRYKTSLMKPSIKALSVSSKLSIRMDSRGFLSLQYMILNEVGQICFVEYLCAPNEDSCEEEVDFF